MNLRDMSIDELVRTRDGYQAKIDGPENDGRVTASGSASLDFWMDMVEEIDHEIAKRNEPSSKEKLMKLEDGKTYRCENGEVFTVRRNSLPYYCFSVQKAHSTPTNEGEAWTENGRAYHDDCGYNIVEEVTETSE